MGFVFYALDAEHCGYVIAISASDYEESISGVVIEGWAWVTFDGRLENSGNLTKGNFSEHPNNPSTYIHIGRWTVPPEVRNTAIPYYQSEAEAVAALKDFSLGDTETITVSWDNEDLESPLTDTYDITISG
jgi:hypothetical protein